MAKKALGPATHQLREAVMVGAEPSERWVVGCSGGPDSLALAAAAVLAAAEVQVGVTTVVVDHGLQPGSAEVAAGVVDQLARHDIAAMVVPVVPSGPGGPEAAARRARLAALTEAAGDDGPVLLGHTMDDQAEQVLLGLARGSGTRSLSAMAPDRGIFRRPFLPIRRAVTVQACNELGLEPWTDPHNSDESFARVRARRTVLPTLERELGPGIVEALGRTADLLRDDADALDDLARGIVDTAANQVEVAELRPHSAAIRRRVLRDWLRAHGARDLSSVHLKAVDGLVTQWRGDGTIQVPGLEVHRVKQQLRI
ncbi:tRNA lysidine(34) synthetase TilS [Propionibacteriaceae bacterium Y1685]|uniref:tRNA lysidine(34) synthetase TilS n=1 Tax=Microlunatus sp. Y1700 TaxID=3418487 RepID=UPI003B78382B